MSCAVSLSESTSYCSWTVTSQEQPYGPTRSPCRRVRAAVRIIRDPVAVAVDGCRRRRDRGRCFRGSGCYRCLLRSCRAAAGAVRRCRPRAPADEPEQEQQQREQHRDDLVPPVPRRVLLGRSSIDECRHDVPRSAATDAGVELVLQPAQVGPAIRRRKRGLLGPGLRVRHAEASAALVEDRLQRRNRSCRRAARRCRHRCCASDARSWGRCPR